MVLPALTVLNPRYAVRRPLGEAGPFSITYLGWDIETEEQVIIQEYLPSELAGRADEGPDVVASDNEKQAALFQAGLKYFLKEAAVLTEIEHPSVIPVRAPFRALGTAYRVWEQRSGMSLAEAIEKKGTLSERAALTIVGAALDALGATHERGLLHGGISPENIFLTKDGRALLHNFRSAFIQLARRNDQLDVAVHAGTSAPEQYAANGKQGPWTDVYACAATVCHVVTGMAPPSAPDRLEDDPLAARLEAEERLTLAVREVLLDALALDPRSRTRSAQAFRQQLQDALAAPAPRPQLKKVETPPAKHEEEEKEIPDTDEAPGGATAQQGASDEEDAQEEGEPNADEHPPATDAEEEDHAEKARSEKAHAEKDELEDAESEEARPSGPPTDVDSPPPQEIPAEEIPAEENTSRAEAASRGAAPSEAGPAAPVPEESTPEESAPEEEAPTAQEHTDPAVMNDAEEALTEDAEGAEAERDDRSTTEEADEVAAASKESPGGASHDNPESEEPRAQDASAAPASQEDQDAAASGAGPTEESTTTPRTLESVLSGAADSAAPSQDDDTSSPDDPALEPTAGSGERVGAKADDAKDADEAASEKHETAYVAAHEHDGVPEKPADEESAGEDSEWEVDSDTSNRADRPPVEHEGKPQQERTRRSRRMTRIGIPLLVLVIAGVVLVAWTAPWQNAQSASPYTALRAYGDSLFAQADYAGAKSFYTQALDIRPDDPYVAERLQAVEAVQGEALQERYERHLDQGDALAVKADSLLSEEDLPGAVAAFEDAKTAYRAGYDVRPNDPVIADRIQEVDSLLASVRDANQQQETTERMYTLFRQQGDEQFASGNYRVAERKYREALDYRPGDAYLREQLSATERLLTERQEKAQYAARIAEADSLFQAERYIDARAQYNRVLEVRPQDSLATARLTAIDDVLAAQNERDRQFQYHRGRGDGHFDLGEHKAAIASYRQALEYRPNDTYVTNRIAASEAALAEQQREAERRRQAIQEQAEALRQQRVREDGVYTAADVEPQLIGGLSALYDELRYPSEAADAGIEGRVYVQVVVNADGSVREASVTKGIGGGCDQEALRVVRRAEFEPARLNGEPVPYRHALWVEFKLE